MGTRFGCAHDYSLQAYYLSYLDFPLQSQVLVGSKKGEFDIFFPRNTQANYSRISFVLWVLSLKLFFADDNLMSYKQN